VEWNRTDEYFLAWLRREAEALLWVARESQFSDEPGPDPILQVADLLHRAARL